LKIAPKRQFFLYSKRILLIKTSFMIFRPLILIVMLFIGVEKGRAESAVSKKDNMVEVTWPIDKQTCGKVQFELSPAKPLIKTIPIGQTKACQMLSQDLDAAFLLTIGKRDLLSQNRWNIFFDRVPTRPYETFPVILEKDSIAVKTVGSRTIVTIGTLSAEHFSGNLEITFYHGSPLFN